MKINGQDVEEGQVTMLEALEDDACCANVAAFHLAVGQDDEAFCGIILEGDRNEIKMVLDMPAICTFIDVIMDAHKKFGIPMSMEALANAREPRTSAPKAKLRSDN